MEHKIVSSRASGEMWKIKLCPKCGKVLELIKAKGVDSYSHTYTLAQMFSDAPICDYSAPAK